MSVQLLAFGAGVLLLAIGILGGGFEVKEIKVPKIGGLARMAAAVVGLGLMFLGLNEDSRSIFGFDQKVEPTASAVEKTSAAPVTGAGLPNALIPFLVRTELSDDQAEEFTQIYIQGRNIGQLKPNPEIRIATLEASVPSEGIYIYALEGFVKRRDGSKLPYRGHGEVEIKAGGIYYVVLDADARKVYLVDRNYQPTGPQEIVVPNPGRERPLIQPARRREVQADPASR